MEATPRRAAARRWSRLAVSDGGLTLALEDPTAARPPTLRFRIVDAGGRPVRDFDVEHEKRMHLIVVRRDLTRLPAPAPELGADGTWRVPLTPAARPAPTACSPTSRTTASRATLAADLRVDGDGRTAPLPAPARRAATADGYDVRLDAGGARRARRPSCASRSRRDGAPVETEPYLGAGGHLVALREGDLAFLHVHPDERRRRRFDADVPDRGPLPPVPAVPARRPRPHRRLHPGGRAMSARAHRAADHGHDLRVVREPHRAQAQQARRRHARSVNYATETATVDFDPAAVEPERARRGGRGGRLRGRAAGAPSRAAEAEADADRAAAPPAASSRAAAVAAGAGDRR